MRILFVIFHGFAPDNGISKKISYQVEALRSSGQEVHLCYMNEDSTKKRMVDDTVIADYGKGLMSKIRKRTDFTPIVQYAISQQIEFVYMRSNHNANPFTVRMVRKMKQAGMKVVMEIPTYPYDTEYVAQGIGRQIVQDRIFRNLLARQLDAIVTFSDYEQIFGQRTIRISNGIDLDSVKVKASVNDTSKELNLIGVAEIHEWHGFDRLVSGLAAYYATPRDYVVRFHVVGYFFSAEGEKAFRQFVADSAMEEYVLLYGKKHGKELDDVFDRCDFGVGSLGRHRVGIQKIKTLKNREYAARGIPFLYSETDSDFDEKPYVLKMPADETPVNIDQLVAFYRQLSLTPKDIRNSIGDLSWKNQMMTVLNNVMRL